MKKMVVLCENEFCIYQKNNICTLDKIELNSMGICDSCIQIDLEPREVNSRKKVLLQKIKEE